MTREAKPEDKYLRRQSDLEAERRPFEDEWKDITRLIYPRRNNWDKLPGEDKRPSSDIYDGTAIAASALARDGLIGKLVPAGASFFKSQPLDDRYKNDKDLMSLLHARDRHIQSCIELSNHYSSLEEAFGDAINLGTAITSVEEGEKGRISFTVRHIKECFISDNRFGETNYVHRKFMVKRETLVEQFEEYLSEQTLKACKDKPDELVELLHVVEPDGEKYKSTYILTEEDTKDKSRILTIDSFDWFPYIVWRFRKNANEAYGHSYAMDALSDVIMINHQAKTMAEAAHLAVKPPLLAYEGLRGKIRRNPDGITYWDDVAGGRRMIESLYGNALGQYPLGIDNMQRCANNIQNHFHSAYFSYLLNEAGAGMRKDRTATEINAIEAQGAAVLGSTIGRIAKEELEPALKIVTAIETSAGRLPTLPEGLKIGYEYTGPLAQKYRQYLKTQNIMDAVGSVSAMAQATNHLEVFDVLKLLEAAIEVSINNGMPETLVRDVREAAKIGQARAEQQAKMQQAAMEIEQAKAVPSLSKAPEAGSPAERMNR